MYCHIVISHKYNMHWYLFLKKKIYSSVVLWAVRDIFRYFTVNYVVFFAKSGRLCDTECTMNKSCKNSANSMAEELQTSTNINITKSVYIAKYNSKYQMEWCEAPCHWTRSLEQWKRVLFGSLGLTDTGRMLPAWLHCIKFNVWWRNDNDIGPFFRGWDKLLISSEGKSFCISIPGCFGQCYVSNFGVHSSLGKDLFCFPAWLGHSAQSKVHKERSLVWEKLQWATQSPVLSSILMSMYLECNHN